MTWPATILFFLAAVAADESVRLHKALFDSAAKRDIAQFETTLTKAREYADAMPLGANRNRLRRAVIVAADLDRLMHFEGIYWDEDSLPDYYDRLASEYPDFGTFIARYRLVEKSGRVLYPVQETRDFLLKKLNPRARSA